ncbi:MAG: hypothetical protein KF889_23760 [Alphaproteobacteria bacterium]|nr:hypothetical protein [Alphaproteobacteria bacterium]MCW5742815.1 hypothetical protein [Alphaproteobacteria bacterium]
MKNWHPDTDLDRLLAALGTEIIDMSDEDVRTLCGHVGTPISGIARDMRARVAAIDDGEAQSAPALTDIAVMRELLLRSH